MQGWGQLPTTGLPTAGQQTGRIVDVSSEATLLDALRAVPGVAAADLEPDERPDGAGTLRLQLAAGADEIAVATSVNRVLREQFGLAVDAGRVQVVEESVPLAAATTDAPQAPPMPGSTSLASGAPHEPVPASAEPARPTLTAVPEYRTAEPPIDADLDLTPQLLESTRPPRILIHRMQLVSAGLGVTTTVSLSWLGNAYLGESSAAATPTSVHRSVATATLRALEEVVGTAARFELEQLEINQLGPDRAVVVVVSMLTKLGSERLTGVSVVREDVRQAVIRATLDALNRRLESLLHPA